MQAAVQAAGIHLGSLHEQLIPVQYSWQATAAMTVPSSVHHQTPASTLSSQPSSVPADATGARVTTVDTETARHSVSEGSESAAADEDDRGGRGGGWRMATGALMAAVTPGVAHGAQLVTAGVMGVSRGAAAVPGMQRLGAVTSAAASASVAVATTTATGTVTGVAHAVTGVSSAAALVPGVSK